MTQADKFYGIIEKLINLHLTKIARTLLLILTLYSLIGVVSSCIIVPLLPLTTLF